MLITGSVVMLAEALEGASDLVAFAALLIGLRISKKVLIRTMLLDMASTFFLDADLSDHYACFCIEFVTRSS